MVSNETTTVGCGGVMTQGEPENSFQERMWTVPADHN